MPDPDCQLWIVAGCNGAGKSTFIASAIGPGGPLEGAPAPNLDRNTGELLREAGYHDSLNTPLEVYQRCFRQADAALQEETRAYLAAGRLVCVETVLSTKKYFALVEFARGLGVPFHLVYVALRSPELAKTRVAQRVRLGGHPVPEDKIVERFHRSLDNLPKFAALADEFWVYDNSEGASAAAPPAQMIHGVKGEVYEIDAGCPEEVTRRFLPRAE